MNLFSKLLLLLLLVLSLQCRFESIDDVLPPLTLSWSPDFRIGTDKLVRFSADAPYAETYLWEFSDGEISDLPDPEKVFEVPGTYSVKLTVEAADGKTFKAEGELFVDPLVREMIAVPGGTFRMGCNALVDDSCEPGLEFPAHDVTLEPFFLSAAEVNQETWEILMGANPSTFSGCPDCPVESVSWNDVQAFIDRLNSLSGDSYFLPSEAQWEYAARAGDTTLVFAGSNDPDSVAWYGNPSFWPQPAALKKPNAWGFFDMSGNVMEWCADHYHDSYDGAPNDGSAWIDAVNPDGYRVIRGGSFLHLQEDCRITARRLKAMETTASDFIGFRLARGL